LTNLEVIVVKLLFFLGEGYCRDVGCFDKLQLNEATEETLRQLRNLGVQQVDSGIICCLERNVESVDSRQKIIQKQQVKLCLLTELSIDVADSARFLHFSMTPKVRHKSRPELKNASDNT
jgi:hypothetical protein